MLVLELLCFAFGTPIFGSAPTASVALYTFTRVLAPIRFFLGFFFGLHAGCRYEIFPSAVLVPTRSPSILLPQTLHVGA